MDRNCPSEPELIAFHVGALADGDVDRVAEHLETCAACETALQRLENDVDPLLGLLRRPYSPLSDAPASSGPWHGGVGEADEGAQLDLPGYELLGVLGRGGMGVVYKARQVRLNRLVALKRLRAANDREAARSRSEAEALGRLQHPYILQIHEVIEHRGRVYLALEFVEGGSLQSKLTGKPQPGDAAAELIELVSRAVHHAHLKGIVHRDLKPANILLARGAQERQARTASRGARTSPYGLPKIADFGIAKWLAIDSGHTEHGDVLGTSTYMAPEQAAGKLNQIGPATDVYSLGVMLYELLTGRVPLQGTTTLETLALVRGEEPMPPRLLQPHVARDLETICLKCLEKEPGRRYASAVDLADDLCRFLNHEPIRARPTRWWEHGWKWSRRHPAVAGLSAALVLVAVIGVAAVSWQWRRAERRAAAEIIARTRAEADERKIERLSASMMLDRAGLLCESGEVDEGLIWMVEALDASRRARDPALERVARLSLAGWKSFRLRERVRRPHSGGVTTAAFHPNGKVLLTGGTDGRARFWDVRNGELAGKALADEGPIQTLAYSPDGKRVLTGGAREAGGETRLWDVSTGKLLGPPLRHDEAVAYVAFCDGGASFATVSASEARIWNVTDGSPVGPPMRHGPMVPDPAAHPRPMKGIVSPDGKLIATGGSDHKVRIWNAATAMPVGEPLEATHAVVALAFSPDSTMLLAGGADGGVRMWEAASGRRRGESLKMRGIVNVVAFSPDGRLAAAAGAVGDPHLEPSGEVQLCQVETGQNLGAALPHPRPVRMLAFSPGGRLLLTGCEDGQARFFLTATSALIAKPLPHDAPFSAAAFSPDGSTAITATAGAGDRPCIRFWAAPAEQAFGRSLVQPGELVSIAFHSDNVSLLASTRAGVTRRWRLDQNAQLGATAAGEPTDATIKSVLQSPDTSPSSRAGEQRLAYSPDQLTAFEAGADGVARLRDVATGKTFGPPLGREGVCCVAFSSDGLRLAAGAFDGKILVWDMWSPLEGSPEQVRLTIELLTGLKLVSSEFVWPCSEEDRQTRRRRLETLGGPVARIE
jgi:WD40 repeat protein